MHRALLTSQFDILGEPGEALVADIGDCLTGSWPVSDPVSFCKGGVSLVVKDGWPSVFKGNCVAFK